jgi:transglutaminase/protease-like cytokinesis protein 3
MKNIFIFIVFVSVFGFAQVKNEFANVDSKMTRIPDSLSHTTTSIAKYINTNFKTENDKIRAVFYWTASNISYDVDKLKTVIQNPKLRSTETTEDRIKSVFDTKKGVCQHYAEVFSSMLGVLLKLMEIGLFLIQLGVLEA